MARDAVRAVLQQPRESLSTLQNTIGAAGENPSRENIQDLAKVSGDIKRLDNAYGAMDAAGKTHEAKVANAQKKHEKRVRRAGKRLGDTTRKADKNLDKTTSGLQNYLGQDRTGGSSGSRSGGR